MNQLEEGIILYHGSYCIVETPDLQKCAKYKDFGQGFYLTTSKEQAKSFAKITSTKAKARNLISANEKFGYVSFYRVNNIQELKTFGFETADNYCISLLLPEKLQNQFCFRTEKALSKLQFLKSEKVALF
ncbi:MAG: DUF3990 domain-containing protein [Treponema sp.]|nr:DUF3990 domain-containing protein [Treponema sp.]